MLRRASILIAAFQWSSIVAAAFAEDPASVIPVDGPRFTARLMSLDDSGQLTFDSSGSGKTISLENLVRWGSPSESRRGSQLVMSHGAVVVVDDLRLENNQIFFESRLLGTASLPVEQLHGIIMRPPAAAQPRDALAWRITTTTGDDDRLLLINGDELTGTITALDSARITIDANVGTIDVATNRVAAVLLNSTFFEPHTTPAAGTWVGLSDGSRLLVDRVERAAETLTLTFSGGVSWQAPAGAIVWLQPIGTRVVYLSDLEAAGYRHISLLDLPWEYHRDRNVLGTALRSGTQRFQKGLGMHSACRLTYRLDEPFSRFEADLALDDVAGPLGSVVYRVYVGTKQRLVSGIIRAGDAPVPVSVDVRGGSSLSLLIEFGERGDVRDYANWLDARLVR